MASLAAALGVEAAKVAGSVALDILSPFAKLYFASAAVYAITNTLRTWGDPGNFCGPFFGLIMAPIAPLYYGVWPWLHVLYYYIDKWAAKGALPCAYEKPLDETDATLRQDMTVLFKSKCN